MELFKVTKHQMINASQIELLCSYDTDSLKKQTSIADKENRLLRILGRYGYRSFLMLADGYVYLCPYMTETYSEKINKNDYLIIDPKRIYIKKSIIRIITSKPNAGQHKEISETKKNHQFINLTKGKKTRYYIFTTTGRIYGIHLIKGGLDNQEYKI